MITFNDTNNLQGLYQHTKFITGQDSLKLEDFTRLANFAADRYSYLALTSSGRWNFDDTRHVNGDDDSTYPIASATLNSGETAIPLATNFLTINQVTVTEAGKKYILKPIDTRDNKDEVLREVYNTEGIPRYYDYNAHSMFIYPASNSSRTIEVAYGRAMKHFDITDTTVTPGIPSIHFEYITLYAIEQVAMKTRDEVYSQARDGRMRMENEIKDWYSRRDQDTPMRIRPKTINTGGKRGRTFSSYRK
jgi:hypothetical protein